MPAWSKRPQDRVYAGRGVLRRRGPRSPWYFHYRNERGHWVARSTRHRDKKGALLWAEGCSLDVTRSEWGLPKPQPVHDDNLIDTSLDGWLEYQKTQNTRCTHRSYTSVVAVFRSFLRERPSLQRLPNITTEVLLEFRQWALNRGNSKVTIDNKMIALRSFFSWCKATRRIGANPASQERYGVRLMFDEVSPRRDTYTDAEYHAIRNAAQPPDRPVYEILANTGLRCSELAMLEWADIKRECNVMFVHRKVTAEGDSFLPKDKTDRVIPVSEPAWQALRALGTEKAGGYVVSLPEVRSRTDYFERTYLGRLKLLEPATGIAEGKLTLHNFRRFFVSHCAEAGIPMATVMQWVGHDEIEMVMHYYRLRDEFSQAAMKRFVASLTEG